MKILFILFQFIVFNIGLFAQNSYSEINDTFNPDNFPIPDIVGVNESDPPFNYIFKSIGVVLNEFEDVQFFSKKPPFTATYVIEHSSQLNTLYYCINGSIIGEYLLLNNNDKSGLPISFFEATLDNSLEAYGESGYKRVSDTHHVWNFRRVTLQYLLVEDTFFRIITKK